MRGLTLRRLPLGGLALRSLPLGLLTLRPLTFGSLPLLSLPLGPGARSARLAGRQSTRKAAPGFIGQAERL